MTSHLPPLVQATAGSLGAVVSGALVFPADTPMTFICSGSPGSVSAFLAGGQF
jgi:hypothetical protein